ncbi:unnamed protein product [Cylindrotheca closterium]|uniref:Uncharacterized protein n=1 Tax=Cylindrotheca closterium TaxID=2856 RepID=A0AAD2CFE0_9STRA|nr:unnamed protein product [Cylindrotheca closterium]
MSCHLFQQVHGVPVLRHYMAVPNGDRANNCFVESDNSSIKRLDRGPKPSNKIHVSALKLAQRDIAYVNNLTVQSIKCSVSTSTRSQQTNTSVHDANLEELTMHIIKSKASLAVEQHCLGSNCYIYYPGLSNSKEQTFYVRENLIRASATRFTSWHPAVPRKRYGFHAVCQPSFNNDSLSFNTPELLPLQSLCSTKVRFSPVLVFFSNVPE